MKRIRWRSFKITQSTFNRLLHIKKDYGLKNGDEIINWLLDNVTLEQYVLPNGDEREDIERIESIEDDIESIENEVDKVIGDNNVG